MDMHEEFWIVLLDRANRAKGVFKVSQGGISGTTCDPRLVFSCALKCLASSIVLAHNHPSGQLRPSEEDIRLTRKLIEGARYLDLSIHDHVILTRDGFYSFSDNGMM
jgi:DNA repair protein RadC